MLTCKLIFVCIPVPIFLFLSATSPGWVVSADMHIVAAGFSDSLQSIADYWTHTYKCKQEGSAAMHAHGHTYSHTHVLKTKMEITVEGRGQKHMQAS